MKNLESKVITHKGKGFKISEDNQKNMKMYFDDLSINTMILKSSNFIQHGNTSCLLHSIAVCYYSLKLGEIMHLKLDKKSLIVGALLHDYFLYDWHEKDSSHRFHGLFHAKRAYDNACRDYDITRKEADIIRHHMFPLTIKPPCCKEGIIVCIVDKICSTYEIFKKYPYEEISLQFIDEDRKNI